MDIKQNGEFPELPDYKTLSTRQSGDAPEGSIWGFWDKPGQPYDKLGSLNLLTPDVVLAAKDEIKAGISVQLDWSLDNLRFTSSRQRLQHSIIDYHVTRGLYIHDDVVSFNTQCGSQWDGFSHYGHQPRGLYYNGVPHSDIQGKPGSLGINYWCERGGIVGRGVLLDYVGYLEANSMPLPDPCTTHGITVEDLNAVVKFQKVDIRTGDILFIRTGFIRWYNTASDDELYRKLGGETSTYIGVKGSEGMKEWLWNHHFSALASDTYAFEMRPHGECSLHNIILPLWGTPIGELFDLEKLAELCKSFRRWTFFVTSAPLNIPNGVASPPNIIAIF